MKDGFDEDATADVISFVVLPSEGKTIRETLLRIKRLFPECATDGARLIRLCELAGVGIAKLSR